MTQDYAKLAKRLKHLDRGAFGFKYWTSPVKEGFDVRCAKRVKGLGRVKGLVKLGAVNLKLSVYGMTGDVSLPNELIMQIAMEHEFADANAFTVSVVQPMELYSSPSVERDVTVKFYYADQIPAKVEALYEKSSIPTQPSDVIEQVSLKAEPAQEEEKKEESAKKKPSHYVDHSKGRKCGHDDGYDDEDDGMSSLGFERAY